MKVNFLGTNGWYDTDTGNTVCVLVEACNEYIIFDAGNGFYKIDRYIKDKKPIHLFLSHYHLDHVIGLHTLNKFNFTQGIDIYGPPGLRMLFKRVINVPYTTPISKIPTKLRLHEIVSNALPLPRGISYKPLKHSGLCYGYRLLSKEKTIAYCTDTGVCDNLLFLANEVDLLIAECSYKKGQNSQTWPHLNPQQAALIAKQATVKKLFLTHFDAGLYLTNNDRIMAQSAARKIFADTWAAKDGLSIQI